MLRQIFGNRAVPDDSLGRSAESIQTAREYLRSRVMFQSYGTQPFHGLSWDYFLADVQLEARAARLPMRDIVADALCDAIDVLPPASIVRLQAAIFVYFTPSEPENEAQVDWLLQPLDAATVKLMRQRRHAVHATQTLEAEREHAEKERRARQADLEGEWLGCPHANFSSEPDDFLGWIKGQTPDTWHVVVDGWDYNCADRDGVIEWIFDQPTCDLATAAQFFFTCGLAGEDPEKLSPGYRRKWHLMKRVADNWQQGLYGRSELQPAIEPSDMRCYDDLVARREAEGRPLPWTIPGPDARRFGGRPAESAYVYEPGHLRLSFAAWLKHRERSDCGKDHPRCCEA